MSRLKYHLVPVTAFSQNCSLITCLETQQTVVVDPGGDVEKIQHALEAAGLTPAKILLTHGHLDHVGAAKALASHYSIPIIGPHSADEFLFDALPVQSQMFGLAHCEAFLPDQWLNEGDTVTVGECQLHVLHCPGHSPGHIVFYHAPSQLLISGDVLFRGGVGRSDLPGGDHQQLIASITEKLLPLGDDVTFIPGHGPVSTLGVEKQSNPFLA